MIFKLLLFGAILTPVAAGAQSAARPDAIGERFVISRVLDTTYSVGAHGSGSSHDADQIMERIIAVTPAGVELKYDLVPSATAEDRARSWQFPARVLRPVSGPLQLLNAAELEARVDGWLILGGFTRENCGQWIFTWNAFLINCDPQTVIAEIEEFALLPIEPQDGLLYSDPTAREPMPMTLVRDGRGQATYVAELAVDPAVVRRARAEADVATAQVVGPLAAALPRPKIQDVSGIIRVTFEVDSMGRLRRRTSVTELQIMMDDGERETRRSVNTLERRLIVAGDGPST